ncbi:hypothetical protein ACSBO6_10200 [Bacillus sp. AL-1R]
MKKFSKKIFAIGLTTVLLPLQVYAQSSVPSGAPNHAKYKSVKLEAVRTKVTTYFKNEDPSIPTNLNWITNSQALDFLPGSVIADVNSTIKDADGVYWIGTKTGLQRVDFSEKDPRDIVQYFAGPRYLYGGDDNVLQLATDEIGGIWVKNESGVTHIAMPKKSLKEKADYMEKFVPVVDRRGNIADPSFTFTESDPNKKYVDYNSPTGSFIGNPGPVDNDNLWTAYYGIGETYRYLTLKREYGKNPTSAQIQEIKTAKDAAIRATKAVLLLNYISGRDNGFPVRTYALTSELPGSTDFGYQTQGGLWFKYIMDGSPNPNGIIPSMQRTDKQPIGYSMVRVTKDAQTKFGDQLYSGADLKDAKSFNGYQLTKEAIEELNKTRPEGQKLGTDIYVLDANGNKQVMPVITNASNKNTAKDDKTTSATNKPLFQLTVPVYEKIPQFFNDLFPKSVIGNDGFIDLNQIAYKADTSSDGIAGVYAMYLTAYTLLCDDSTSELIQMKDLIAEATEKMTNLILKNDNYYIEDATGKSTQWAKWSAKYLNDNLNLMKQQPLWEENVGVYPDGTDALSYGFEDGPLKALDLMAILKTTATVTKEKYPMEQLKFKSAYDLTYDSAFSSIEPYVNGKGYINMAQEYIERRLVRQATWGYNLSGNNKETVTYDNILSFYTGDVQEDSNLNGTLHKDWTQYINYSDEQLCWFPVYQLILQEKNPERLKQITEAFSQWYENEKREENPFYTFLYQLANPEDTKVDLKSAVRYLYRTPALKINFDAQYDRQDVFYIEPNDRDGGKAQTNYPLPLDEKNVHKNNINPFQRTKNGVTYAKNANYNYKAGTMFSSSTYTLPYWFGRYFEMIEESK